jgi:hypothetical protein
MQIEQDQEVNFQKTIFCKHYLFLLDPSVEEKELHRRFS